MSLIILIVKSLFVLKRTTYKKTTFLKTMLINITKEIQHIKLSSANLLILTHSVNNYKDLVTRDSITKKPIVCEHQTIDILLVSIWLGEVSVF